MSGDYEKIRKDIEEKFVLLLKESFGGDLASVILYGSAARGAYRGGVSDVNILILLEKSDPKKIYLFGKSAFRLILRRKITPLIMTRAEFVSSADVFPLEYHDIRDSHRVLYGKNDTADLDLTRTNLRHQTEERLRGAVNDLRQILIASGGRDKLLARQLKGWSGAGNALFRGLLSLKNIEAADIGAEELLSRTGEAYDVSMRVFSDLNKLRRGEKIDVVLLAAGILEALKDLTRKIDVLPDEGAGS